MMQPIKVCIDARLISGQSGGIEQSVIGLVYGLSCLDAEDLELYYLTYKNNNEWLRPYIKNVDNIVEIPPPMWHNDSKIKSPRVQIKRILRAGWDLLGPTIAGSRSLGPVPKSDGLIEKLGIDVIHFPFQRAFLTDVPSIYQPWDMQHLHLPDLFTPRERLGRDHIFEKFCSQAKSVVVSSQYVKNDLIKHLSITPDKIDIIPMASALMAYKEPNADQLTSVKRKHSLPDRFLLYPAQTFRHKNHIRLLHALELLRSKYSVVIPMIFTGKITEHYKQVMKVAVKLNLDNQLRFLGFIAAEDIYALYKLSRAVVFPTLYEGWGFPLLEALQVGVPVASSNVSGLLELAGDAALFFDPMNTESIAAALFEIWTDDALRTELVLRGLQRANDFSWERTARKFQEKYRTIGNKREYPLEIDSGTHKC